MRPRWPQLVMLLPTQGLLVLVIFLPALWVFWLSLQKTSFGLAPVYVGLANYAFVLGDLYFWRSLVNTLVLVNIIVYLELAVALGIAVLFAAGVPWRRLMIAILLAPYAVSEVIAVIIWKYMLEPEVGIVSQGLAAMGIPELAWTTDRWAALTLVALLSVWLHLPFSFLLLYSARLGLPRSSTRAPPSTVPAAGRSSAASPCRCCCRRCWWP